MASPSSSPRFAKPAMRHVSEGVREHETFKYASVLSSSAKINDTTGPLPDSELSTCPDVLLTALAQLGACQTRTGRSLISLFDADRQYIVAEATPSQSLSPGLPSTSCPEPLWLCGTAIPRTYGVCEATLLSPESDLPDINDKPGDLPITLANDLTVDSRFCAKPYCQPGSLARFYAAVPIRTRRGINIGVYCVIDETPGRPWTSAYTTRLREISEAIMEHLETLRLKELHRRNDRMNRGLGSFVEGHATVFGLQLGSQATAYENQESNEGALNQRQQSLQTVPDLSLNTGLVASASPSDSKAYDVQSPDQIRPSQTVSRGAASPAIRDESSTDSYSPQRKEAVTPESRSSGPHGRHAVFSRAANIVRESIEVEGCVYYRPNPTAYAHKIYEGPQADDVFTNFSTLNTNEENTTLNGGESRSCHVLGFSTSDESSIDSALHSFPEAPLPEEVLTKLLRKYPTGQIFNFDAAGVSLFSESLDDEVLPLLLQTSHPVQEAPEAPAASQASSPRPIGHRGRRGSLEADAKLLSEAFPGARSVAFVPIWDSRKDTWCAGTFVYTKVAHRTFSVQGELSYLRAFGAVTASEVHRLETSFADQAKADALDSISHELRSPLHGAIFSADLLLDTDLDQYQDSLAHTIEICSRTLLDTIDHLLDFSQINSFSRRRSAADEALSSKRKEADQFGKKNLYLRALLDCVVEEVVESVFAGFTSEYQPLRRGSIPLDRNGNSMNQFLDSTHASKLSKTRTSHATSYGKFEGIFISLSIDPRCQWLYDVHVGAIRRIVMNLFGNALKYTTRGTITVTLNQETVTVGQKTSKLVRIMVQDTGKGMSTEFIENGLFRPFCQEDSLAPGTGLGLSLVKRITSQLHGRIHIDSEAGLGTTVKVTLPLEAGVPAEEDDESKDGFQELLHDLKGLRVLISGVGGQDDPTATSTYAWLRKTCYEWLQMEIITDDQAQRSSPDIVLWPNVASLGSLDDVQAFAKRPNVVVCTDAIMANKWKTKLDFLDLVSQP